MSPSVGYYRWPDIYKNKIIFVSEDYLWILDTSTDHLYRLTDSGRISYPKISQDGRHIAFVGNNDGDNEIYTISINGGPVKRLTYEGSNPRILCWKDNDIIYTSNFETPLRRRGESHIRSINYNHHHSSIMPYGIGHSIAFGSKGQVVLGRNTNDPARWKRYRGGTAGELWIDSSGNNNFIRLLDIDSNITSPMLSGDRLFFISDHDGIGNIYSSNLLGRDLKKCTYHKEFYVRNASISGAMIIYHSGGDLYTLDTGCMKTDKVIFDYNSSKNEIQRKFVNPYTYLESASVDKDSMHIMVTSRGKLFSMGLWSGSVSQFGDMHGTRYQYPTPTACGKKFIVVSDKNRTERLEVRSMSSGSISKIIDHKLIGRPYIIKQSFDPNIIALVNHRHQIVLINIKKNKVSLIDRSQFHQVSGIDFSKYGRYLTYSCSYNSRSVIIKVFDLDKEKKHEITKPVLHDYCPSFDPNGDYIYCLSARTFNPVYDGLHFDLNFPKGTKPYLITLDNSTCSPFIKQPEPYLDNSSNRKDKKKNKKDRAIDFKGIKGRMLEIPVSEGKYDDIKGGSKGKIFYTTSQIKGSRDPDWYDFDSASGDKDLYYYDLNTLKEKKFLSNISDFFLGHDKKTILVRVNNKLRLLSTDSIPSQDTLSNSSYSKASGRVDLSRISIEIDQIAEWKQMYSEAWRLQRDYFWTDDMSKVDWELIHDRYISIIDRLGSRSEFSDLIWEMQGELGTSHAYEFGGDYRSINRYNIGFLGCDYVYDYNRKKFKIKKILNGDIWNGTKGSPLIQPGVSISKGDLIERIDGKKIDLKTPPGKALVNLSGKRICITTRSASNGKLSTIDLITLGDDASLRYRDWVEMNREYVHKESNNKIGYIHIPDMGPEGYAEFHRYFLAEVEYESLIVDVRFNGGGHVSQLLLEKLARKRMGYGLGRWMGPESYPSDAIEGDIIAITNEYAGSDGDIFSHTFKLMKLGKLIGKRTWGGVVGIWPRNSLVDGTITTQPEYSFWFNDVGFGVENYGTDVDIEVHNTPLDFVKKHDAQLDRAILELKKSIKKNPVKRPSFIKKPNLKLPK